MEFLDGSTNEVVQQIENSVASDSSCTNQDPKARITNNGTTNVDLEIYNVNGDLVGHEYSVEPGHHSDWIEFSCGETTFLVSTGSADKLVVINMGTCMMYDMEVGSNNQLVSNQAVQL